MAQGAARSAVVRIVVSSIGDVPAVVRGEMSGREFAENRGVDAVEAAAVTTFGTAATSAVLATTMGGAAAAAASPVIVVSAVMLGTGLAVGKGFRQVRRVVKERQEERRALTDGGSAPA